ncbi:MAG: putative phosphodiesterase [Gammaproteobacteria bacterium]|jgi:predicted phosphodiesterase
MKIQILSDLHNEFLRSGEVVPLHHWSCTIPKTDAEIIILAGDIDTGTRGAEWAIIESERLAKPILYVLGNHEFYDYEYWSLKEEIFKLCEGTQVFFLDSDVFTLDDVRFIGTTLWTNYTANIQVPQDLAMLNVDKFLADHRRIKIKSGDLSRRFKPEHALAIHAKELRWLEKKLAQSTDLKTVVITHHGPHAVCQHPDFALNEMTAAFYSDLDDLIESNHIDSWIFGHTHANVDEFVFDTRIVSNQAGYPGENVSNFDAHFTIEI